MKTNITILAILFSLFFSDAQAQEAFYIYRNDGDFNGFFYDEVSRMGVSKTDLNGEEHDEYVVQEIQTADSLYRIPLAVIDSVGFQQPEIIMSKNFYEINGVDSPVRSNGYDFFYSSDDGYTLTWPVDDTSTLPKVGQVIYSPEWCSWSVYHATTYPQDFDRGPFIGKVKAVRPSEYPLPDYAHFYTNWYDVVCEPITDLSDVFEQLVTVEQIGNDESGQAKHRMAGADRIRRRVGGNKDITLVNLEGSFPFSRGGDTYSASISLDLSLKIRAQVAYNISRKLSYIGVTLKEDAEVGASFTAKYNMEEVTTWHLAGMPVYFPGILPIFQLDPSPEAFIKTTGDISVKVSSPKFAYHGSQSFHIGTDRVDGTCTNECPPPGSDDNDWSLELSLNGSLQAGSNFPVKLETNRWAEKAIYASVGADVYVGPKFSSSFTLDPVALAKGDVYQTFSSTNVTLAPVCTVFEANAEYSIRNRPMTTTKFFEGQRSFGDMTLKLFPEFEKTKENQTTGSNVTATIYPRGNSLPYYIGIGAYNEKKEFVSSQFYDERMYSVWNMLDDAFDEVSLTTPLVDGKYYIVPVLNVFGYTIPAWGSETEVECFGDCRIYDRPTDGKEKTDKDYITIAVTNVMPDDEVEFVLESDESVMKVYEPQPDLPSNIISYRKKYNCGQRVSFQEDETLRSEYQSLGADVSHTRFFRTVNDLEYWAYYKDVNGDHRWYYKEEYNKFRAKITRGGHVRQTANTYTFRGHGSYDGGSGPVQY